MATKTIIDKNFNGDFNITIYHRTNNGYEKITPIVEDGIKWETDRQGSPGKLTFKLYSVKNAEVNFQEGDEVRLNFYVDGTGWIVLFYGYVFTKKRDKDGWIDVTAYDQLRYFKNKATYVYTNKKASDLVKMIVNDYKLSTGTIENTSYVIGSRVEDNQSLFDIIQTALDQTLISSGELYVLYADSRGVCLRNAKNMRTNFVVNESVAENFEYTSTIDDETYNEIELYYDNDETNKREYYHAIDMTNAGNWGRLRYTEQIQNPTNVKDRVKKMLSIYNRKTRKLSVNGTFGDYRCRAGASVIVQLDLGDIAVSNYMMIEKATHTFKKDEYRMDLTLDGFNEDVTKSSVRYSEVNTNAKKNQITPNAVAKPTVTTKTTTKKTAKTEAYAFILNIENKARAKYFTPNGIAVEYYDKDNVKQKEFLTYQNGAKLNIPVRVGSTVSVWFLPFIDKHAKVTDFTGDWKSYANQTLGTTTGCRLYKATADKTLKFNIELVRRK